MSRTTRENLSINTSHNNSAFSLPSPSSSISEDDLPYPLALPRNDFLSNNFSPHTYLSTLSTRHQTLEDLRSDLRDRSTLLSTELLDLVNNNYEAFLSLGHELRGGEEKVEDVRVGLLAVQRGIEEVKAKVGARREVARGLLEESKAVKGDIEVGRNLLEVWERVEELEEGLLVKSLSKENIEWSDSESDSEDEDGTGFSVRDKSIKKLEVSVEDLERIEELVEDLPPDHPFLKSLDVRMAKVRNTLVLDLASALKSAKRDVDAGEESGSARLLRILKCFGDVGKENEAVKILRSIKA